MRRVVRHLFTICSFVSLLLCVAVCVLWVSAPRESWVTYGIHGELRLSVSGATVCIHTTREPSLGAPLFMSRSSSRYLRKDEWDAPPAFFRLVRWPTRSEWVLTTASPALAFMAAILPLLYVFRRWVARDRRSAGVCARCGYDLRASPERCPECGAETAHIAA
jgi:hypothetical protein